MFVSPWRGEENFEERLEEEERPWGMDDGISRWKKYQLSYPPCIKQVFLQIVLRPID